MIATGPRLVFDRGLVIEVMGSARVKASEEGGQADIKGGKGNHTDLYHFFCHPSLQLVL